MASTIKVDNVQNQPGTNIINKCSVTTTIGAGAGETINVCGATVNIGRCGGTVALAAGASQTGFGRTGTVDWVTTIQTSTPFTAVSGKGYFINTTAGVITINLPSSPSVGDIVAVKDYAGTFDTQNLTIGRGGSNMNGSATDSVRDTENESLTLVYADATKGWIPVEEGTGYVGETFLAATGGTPACGTICGDYKIHTFTGPGTFTVSKVAGCAANNLVSYMVVAGGGSGGNGGNYGAGGGAGGFRELVSPTAPYTASPLDGYPNAPNRITVTATPYPITTGGGGAGAGPSYPGKGNNGNTSTFSTITAAAGGGGGTGSNPPVGVPGAPTWGPGNPGGSGGGAGGYGPGTQNGGTGNTPSVNPAQGTNGGPATSPGAGYSSAGGGGATVAGATVTNPGAFGPTGGNGGAGATTHITGSPVAYAGGGGGGAWNAAGGTGGSGGGRTGTCSCSPSNATDGTDNRGGGGGGGSKSYPPSSPSGLGGSGIVVIRYKFQ